MIHLQRNNPLRYRSQPPRAKAKRRLAAAAVEFAIASQVFFLVLLSIFEFGWLNVIRHTADNAAYEATRIAIVPGATAADATNEANRILGIVGTRSATVTVIPAVLTEKTETVEVRISVPARLNGIIASKFMGNTVFESSSKMLTERPRKQK